MNALSQSINREQRKIGRKLESINHEKRNALIELYDDLEEIEGRTIHPEDNVSMAKGINDIQKVIKAVRAI